MTEVIWKKTASPTCHPLQMPMDSSWSWLHVIRYSLGPQESAPHTASQSFQPLFVQCNCVTSTQTDRQTTLHATYDHRQWITLMHCMQAMQPKNAKLLPYGAVIQSRWHKRIFVRLCSLLCPANLSMYEQCFLNNYQAYDYSTTYMDGQYVRQPYLTRSIFW